MNTATPLPSLPDAIEAARVAFDAALIVAEQHAQRYPNRTIPALAGLRRAADEVRFTKKRVARGAS